MICPTAAVTPLGRIAIRGLTDVTVVVRLEMVSGGPALAATTDGIRIASSVNSESVTDESGLVSPGRIFLTATEGARPVRGLGD